MPITALEIAGRDDEEKMLSRRSGGGGCWRCLSSFVSVALLLASGAALGAGGVLVAQYYTHEDLTLVVLQLYKKERASPLLPVPLPWSRGGSPAPNTSLPGSSTSLPGANASLAVRGSAFADYSVAVTIGGQSFQVIVDTGSSVFAVAASSIDHCSPYYEGACDGATLPTQVYGSGTWDGRVCSGASVKMGGLRAGEPPFAGMLSEVGLLKDCEASISGLANQGIVGMAYRNLVPSGSPLVPLFDSVAAANGIPNLFSMQCCGWTGGGAGVGTLTLGGIDTDQYSGEIAYTPVIQRLWFCVHLTGPVDYAATSAESCPTIVDSGTSGLVLQSDAYDAIYAPIAAAVQRLPSSCVLDENVHSLPCITLELQGGVVLTIPPSVYFQPTRAPTPGGTLYCRQLLLERASPTSSFNRNILGQVVLEAYYTVFDKDKDRVGFARIAGCGAEQPSFDCAAASPPATST